MKKVILATMLAATLIFSFSCKKDDNEETTATGFSAKIEGNIWTAQNTLAGHSTLNNITQVTGMSSTGAEQIHLIFKGSGTGTFKMNDDNMGAVEITNYSFTSFFSDTPVGEIVITKYDATNMKISGTFKFEGEDIDGTVYHLTEGKFDNVVLVIQ
jgi:hypothetical protein